MLVCECVPEFCTVVCTYSYSHSCTECRTRSTRGAKIVRFLGKIVNAMVFLSSPCIHGMSNWVIERVWGRRRDTCIGVHEISLDVQLDFHYVHGTRAHMSMMYALPLYETQDTHTHATLEILNERSIQSHGHTQWHSAQSTSCRKWFGQKFHSIHSLVRRRPFKSPIKINYTT